MIRYYKINEYERGLVFRENALAAVLRPGAHWFLDPLLKLRLRVVSTRDPWIKADNLDVIAKSAKLRDEAVVIDLGDHERAIVWIDGRVDRVLGPGLYALWTVDRSVRVEVIDAREGQLVREDLAVVIKAGGAAQLIDVYSIEPGCVGVLYRDGAYMKTLAPGTYAFWKDIGRIKMIAVDMKEQTLDISGQEIMTADKVTLRLNALVSYRVVDALKYVSDVDDAKQALYRATQLALRESIGARELDVVLTSKEEVAVDLAATLAARAAELGMTIVDVGIRDVILPGEMKDLMNRVIEAKKAAEASLITRREETAAMRMQVNTAKLLENNPMLMKMRELEVLEKVSDKANLTVVLGEGSLADRVVKMV